MCLSVSRVTTQMAQQLMRMKLYTNSQIIPELLWQGHWGLDRNRIPETLRSLARPGMVYERSENPARKTCSSVYSECFVNLSLSFCPGLIYREKLYEEKLRQQKQELKQLHEERQRLIEIQGKIQDLQWACPDLQVFYTQKHTHIVCAQNIVISKPTHTHKHTQITKQVSQ